MKKINKFLTAALFAATLASCSQEAPFSSGEDGMGHFATSSLSLDVKTDQLAVRSAATVPSASEFTIEFCKASDPSTVVKSYDRMAEMPEVVSLTPGDYVIKATYGGTYGSNGETAGFDKPHYFGQSDPISVKADQISDDTKTIVCRLANVRVSVDFDETLKAAMSPDSKVLVKVGESGELEFTSNTTTDGFFYWVEGSHSLVATFSGKVSGVVTEEIKTYGGVKAGNYYKITFRLHVLDPNDPGELVPDESGLIIVDASVTHKDFGDTDAGLEDDSYVEDDMRPENGEKPGKPDEPSEPSDPTDPTAKPVTIVGVGVDIDKVNLVTDDMTCKLNIITESQIKEFLVNITSNNPGFMSALEDFGFTETLDLVNENDMWTTLGQLGLPTGEEVTNPTAKDENGNDLVVFDVTTFMSILNGFEGLHEFKLTVTNAGGTVVKTLKLEVRN